MSGILQDNYWFSDASSLELGNSLRCRPNTSLYRDYGTDATTAQGNIKCYVSFWLKKSALYGDVVGNDQAGNVFSWKAEAGFQKAITQCTTYDWGGVTGNIWGTAKADVLQSRGIGATLADRARWTPLLRDPNAWQHFFMEYDGSGLNDCTTNSWMNGVLMPKDVNDLKQYLLFRYFTVGAVISDGSDNIIGGELGYLSEFHFLQLTDGSSRSATDFGEYNTDGVWVAKKYTGAYGTNGFYLDFSDPNNIGADRSGNGNDFTANGYELTDTTSFLYDWYTDSPTTNSSLWNPLDGSTQTEFFESNATAQRLSGSDYGQSVSSIQYMDGKVSYSEHYMGSVGADFGVAPNNFLGVGNYIYGVDGNNQNGFTTGLITYYEDGNIYIGSTLASTGIAMTTNCKIGVKVDRSVTPNTVQFYKDGTASGSALSLATGDILYGFAYTREQSGNFGNVIWNSGGQPWQHAPAGITREVNAVTAKNLPAVTIPNPSDHFDVITDTGANILTAAQSKFSDGLWIVKDTVNTNNWQWVDSLRGNQAWTSNLALPQSTYAAPSGSSIAYCWKTVETFTGTGITAGERNVLAGFSMVTYTGDGTTPRAIPHGLGKKPGHVIVKAISGASYPGTTQFASFGPSYYNQMDSPNTGGTSTVWANTDMDATNFYVGNNIWSNASGVTYVAYIWAPIEGYSHECKVQFNGTADGPFIYTGFSPAFSLIKLMVNGTTGPWEVNSTGLNQYNPVDMAQSWETTSSSYVSDYPSDFVSNGVKHLSPYSSTFEYGYMAFAKHPFGGSNVAPATAR